MFRAVFCTAFMFRTLFILILASLLPAQVAAQANMARRALKQMHKQEFGKADQFIIKGLSKDSLNPEVRYVKASLFFTNDYPAFDIDSAYVWINLALSDLDSVDEKRLKKMSKLPLDSVIMLGLRAQIDSAAFQRALNEHTEDAYIFFIKNFTNAKQLDSARLLRDKVAFENARRVNTYASYKDFLDKYPHALQAKEAKDRYEELLFLDRTKDRKLRSFESFLVENPETPFKPIIIKNIFEISTAGAEENSYLNFIKRFSDSKEAKRARDILYHLRKEYAQGTSLLSGIANDSLRIVVSLDNQALFPFIWQGKFGFMNAKAEELIKPVFTEIDPEYLCGNVADDFFIHDRKIIARNGKTIYAGVISDVEDLGFGYLLIQNRNCFFAIHKSGFNIGEDCIDDAVIIADSFLALKKKNWALYSLAGKQLSDFEYKDIQTIEGLILIQFNNNRAGIYNSRQIAGLADGEVLPVKNVFDEVKLWSEGLIWVRSADREGLMDAQFKFVVPLAKQKLSSSKFGLLSISDKGRQFLNHEQLKGELYDDILIGSNWMALKKSDRWRFWLQPLSEMIRIDFDSVSLMGPVPLGHRNDSSFVFSSEGKIWHINTQQNVRFAGAINDLYFMLMDERDRTFLLDDKGKRLFRVTYEKIEPIAPEVFAVEQKSKKGLIDIDGKIILKPEYNAFALSSQDAISTLKDKKFGLYLPQRQAIIPPEYDRNIQFYSSEILVAYQQGFYAFIDWTNKPLSGFEFEAFEYWNDSVAIVKQHFQWKLFDLKERTFVMSNIKSYKLIRNDEQEKLAIINQDNGYGVISNINGIIIPPTFSDIVNIGSDKQPFYFTEKHVEEAAYFVVVYYNQKGEVVKRQAFEADEYEKIYCVKK